VYIRTVNWLPLPLPYLYLTTTDQILMADEYGVGFFSNETSLLCLFSELHMSVMSAANKVRRHAVITDLQSRAADNNAPTNTRSGNTERPQASDRAADSRLNAADVSVDDVSLSSCLTAHQHSTHDDSISAELHASLCDQNISDRTENANPTN
jgi:hypothetical protein